MIIMTNCCFSFAEEKLQYRNILSIRIQYSITKMLLLISTVFIMLNLPRYVGVESAVAILLSEAI